MESTLADVINRLWAEEIPCDDRDQVLAALRALADRLFDPDIDTAGVCENFWPKIRAPFVLSG
jgi:7,8-dihydro-6-hydroxymethylpterin dimethyltransferase